MADSSVREQRRQPASWEQYTEAERDEVLGPLRAEITRKMHGAATRRQAAVSNREAASGKRPLPHGCTKRQARDLADSYERQAAELAREAEGLMALVAFARGAE